MQPTSVRFDHQARRALADAELQRALSAIRTGWQPARARAAAALPEFDALRDLARDLKDHVLAHLDLYLEAFEAAATAVGARVHWARDAAEAREIVLGLCEAYGARSVTKSKSMVAEEIGLAEALEGRGISRVETDLGEYIIQLAHEPPSHLIGPAVHFTKERIAKLFAEHHGGPELTQAEALVAEARRVLRQKYFEAEVGITGANFLVAETGSVITVTNEGNAELTQGLPRHHIVVTGIEKLVPTMEDAFTFLRILARSATGQEFSAYTTVITGPKRAEDLDGPETLDIVLVDNGRSALHAGRFREILRCIRCGACMNHCPVYLAIGGHAYGWTYVGPMGAVLTPQFVGLEQAWKLPEASTFCGRCEEVCPVRIPLPRLMRFWREEAWRRRLPPAVQRSGLRIWAFLATRPRLYRLAARLGSGILAILSRGRGRLRWLPGASGWTAARDFPAPEGGTFFSRYQRGRR
ncbi:Lactate utilization protein B [bacterium HR40]|nr:Lactate utilization protein B [bacterium HR40]